MGLIIKCRKVVQIILVIIICTVYFYSLYFYPYIKKTDDYIYQIDTQLNKKTLKKLYYFIEQEKIKNLKAMKSKSSINTLVRSQTIISFYLKTKKDFNRNWWRVEVLIWSFFSHVSLNIEDIKKIYIYQKKYRLPRNLTNHNPYVKIYEYSQVFFKKNINELTDGELKKLYFLSK